MRTTLTLDDDVAALVEEVRLKKRQTFKQIVNDGLRQGLASGAGKEQSRPFRTREADLGRVLVDDLDRIAEVLEYAEGPAYR